MLRIWRPILAWVWVRGTAHPDGEEKHHHDGQEVGVGWGGVLGGWGGQGAQKLLYILSQNLLMKRKIRNPHPTLPTNRKAGTHTPPHPGAVSILIYTFSVLFC